MAGHHDAVAAVLLEGKKVGNEHVAFRVSQQVGVGILPLIPGHLDGVDPDLLEDPECTIYRYFLERNRDDPATGTFEAALKVMKKLRRSGLWKFFFEILCNTMLQGILAARPADIIRKQASTLADKGNRRGYLVLINSLLI